MEEIWNADRRAELQAWFAPDKGEVRQALWKQTEARIDDYVQRSEDERAEACAPDAPNAVRSCAHQRRARLEAVLDGLSGLSTDAISRADVVLRELDKTCHAASPGATNLVAELARAGAAAAAVGDPASCRAVEAVADKARDAEDPGLEAFALREYALCLSSLNEWDLSREALRRGAAAAQRAGDNELLAKAWSMLASNYALLGDPKEARVYVDVARGTVEAAGESMTLRADLEQAEGHIAMSEGRHRDADEHYRAALTAAEATTPRRPKQEAIYLLALSVNARASGRMEDAIDHATAARERLAAAYGSAHPAVHQAEISRANALLLSGRRPEAIASYEAALHKARQIYPAGHEALGLLLQNLGSAMLGEERTEEAAELLLRAVAGVEPSHPAGWMARANLIRALVRLDRSEEAEPVGREVERAVASLPANHPDAWHLHDALGQLREAQADWPRSVAAYRAALDALPEAGADDSRTQLQERHDRASARMKKNPLE